MAANENAAFDIGVKLPCGCYGAYDDDGYLWITAAAFLCEARHKQSDLVEVREGRAK